MVLPYQVESLNVQAALFSVCYFSAVLIMSKYIRYTLLFLWFFAGGFLISGSAQEWADTTILTEEVVITDQNIRTKHTGTIVGTWSADTLTSRNINNIAELLGVETGVYVKNYGPGSLATSAVRGGSAGHTLVLWNGLPVQSPMLGLLDLSLLPTSSVETVEFVAGSNAAMWGSGAIGGLVSLKNEPDFRLRTKVSARVQAGSFGHFLYENKIGLGNKNWQSVSRYADQKAENDFLYPLAPGLPLRRQTNAAYRQQSFLQDFYWNITKKQRLTLHYWFQKANRQIPPTNVQSKSEAEQADLSHRIMFDYKIFTKRGFWLLKSGLFSEKLNYEDPINLEKAENEFFILLNEFSGQWSWQNKHFLQLGTTHSHTKARANGYRSVVPEENRLAFFASWKMLVKKWTFQTGLRQEWIGQQRAPFLPSWAAEYQVLKNGHFFAKINRNYRFPTLNDRYWRPGGNPDLLPESGWSGEVGSVYEFRFDRLKIKSTMTWYYRNINQWILWSIQEGAFFFSANNITRVVSRGWEPRMVMEYKKKSMVWSATMGYDYIRSTNQVAVKNPKIEAGSQLIYTPVHQGFINLQTSHKYFSFMYQHRFTGASQGINERLPSFFVGNVHMTYHLNKKSWTGSLFLHINNVWNKNYVIVERRPMPGIHFQGGFSFQFLQKQP